MCSSAICGKEENMPQNLPDIKQILVILSAHLGSLSTRQDLSPAQERRYAYCGTAYRLLIEALGEAYITTVLGEQGISGLLEEAKEVLEAWVQANLELLQR